jgi:hypothetical protein
MSLFSYLTPDYLLSNQSTEEIELESDTLPASVLTKLYIWPLRASNEAKPNRKRDRRSKAKELYPLAIFKADRSQIV